MVVSTQGWDTAYVLRLTDVNAAIRNAVSAGTLVFPPFAWQSRDRMYSIEGSFGPWQLTSEGGTSGTKVNMRFPVLRAKLTGPGGMEKTIENVTLVGTVELRLLSSGTVRRFGVDPKKGVQLASHPGMDSTVRLALKLFLSEHLESFGHVFATIDFNSKVAQTVPWLAPKALGYCYQGGRDDSSSYLGLLCMTGEFVPGNPTPPATLAVSIPQDASCAFLMSRQLFVENLLAPGVIEGFKLRMKAKSERGLTPSQLARARSRYWLDIASDGSSIVKKARTPPVHLRKAKADLSWLYAAMAGGLVSPWSAPPAIALAIVTFFGNLVATGKPAIMGFLDLWIEGFDIRAENGEITVTASLAGYLKLPILGLFPIDIATVHLSVTSTHKVQMTADGKLHLQSLRPPTHTEPKVLLAKWITTGGDVSKGILTVVQLIVSIATEGVGAVLSALLLAVVEAGIGLFQRGAEMSARAAAEQGAPVSLDGFVSTAINPVAWTGSAGIEPTGLVFDQALLIAGNPT
jgi:hypothetical protein